MLRDVPGEHFAISHSTVPGNWSTLLHVGKIPSYRVGPSSARALAATPLAWAKPSVAAMGRALSRPLPLPLEEDLSAKALKLAGSVRGPVIDLLSIILTVL